MTVAQNRIRQDRQARKQAHTLLAQLRGQSKNRILAQLRASDPRVFEHVSALLLEQRGYRTKVIGMTGDEGVDVLARRGIKKAVVQCKRYNDTIGQSVVRDLYGTMLHNKAEEAYLITSALISRQAQAWAGGKPIHLIDGYTLVEWITAARRRWMLPWRWLVAVLALALLALLVYLLLINSGSSIYLPLIRSDR